MNLADLSKIKKLLDTRSGEGSVNLKALTNGGTRDQLHLGDLLKKSVVCLFIEDDGGVEFFSNFLLVPLCTFVACFVSIYTFIDVE